MDVSCEEDPLGLASWPNELHRDAVGPALEAFAEVVGDIRGLRPDHHLGLRERGEGSLESPFAEAFKQDRGDYGTAMAKTIRSRDCRSVVVFDVRLFTKGAPPADRMFRHEALHVLLNRSSENTFDSRAVLAARTSIYRT